MSKLFVFGIDGAMPEKIFSEWLDEMPNIKKLIDSGCYAKLNSCIPPISINAWTSITTGKKPEDHGIFELFYKDESTNKLKLVSNNNVKEKRIWELTEENNIKSISCFVPLTYPIKPYNGIIVAGPPNPSEQTSKITHPENLKTKLNTLLNKQLLLDIKHFRNLSKEDIEKEMYNITQMHLDSIKYLIKNKEWEFFFTSIKSSDRMNHSFWKYCDPQHREYEPESKSKDTLKNYYKFIDKELGKIIKLLKEDTTIIVLSDHGITRMHSRINFSDWLIKEGYLVLKEEITKPTPLELDMIDWEKTKAHAFGAYDCQIHINDKVVKDKDPLMEELEAKIKNIKGSQGEKLNTKIFKNFQGKYQDTAPDMIIYFDDLQYGSNTTRVGNEEMYSKQTALGSDNAAHSKQGIFIMNNSEQQGQIPDIDITDIFPTILNKFKIKIPEDIKGKIIQ